MAEELIDIPKRECQTRARSAGNQPDNLVSNQKTIL